MFALVTFVQSDEINIVPVNWLKGNQCYWPITKDVQRLVRTSQEPKSEWPRYEVNVKAVYVTYEEASHNEKKYEDSSNVESEKDLGISKNKRTYSMRTEETSGEESYRKKRALSYPDSRYYLPSVKKENESIIHVEKVSSAPEQYYMVLAENREVSSSNKQCSCDCSEDLKFLKEQMSQMRAVLRDQSQAVSEISEALNKLAENCEEQDVTEESSFSFQLPIASKEELLKLEEALFDDKVKNHLFEKMVKVGGTHLGNNIRRMLTRLITNEVAVQYSWLGTKEKDPFKDFKVAKILFDVVRKNKAFLSSDRDIETAIKDWLRHAKARCLSKIL